MIDPADFQPVVQEVKNLKVDPVMALITHKHNDHAGGNEGVKEAFPDIDIIGTSYEPIPALSTSVKEGDIFQLGSLEIQVIHVPCHTKGHVAYYVKLNSELDTISLNNDMKDPILFCGDTLFVGGCGRFVEGTAEQMLTNMDRLSQLPHETQVYCAHEYTTSNLKFLSHIDSEVCTHVYENVLETRKLNLPTVPSTIGKELSYNLFMKCREARTQMLVLGVEGSPIDTMAKLREMKNSF